MTMLAYQKIMPGSIKAVLGAFTRCGLLGKPLKSSAQLGSERLNVPSLSLLHSNTFLSHMNSCHSGNTPKAVSSCWVPCMSHSRQSNELPSSQLLQVHAGQAASDLVSVAGSIKAVLSPVKTSNLNPKACASLPLSGPELLHLCLLRSNCSTLRL